MNKYESVLIIRPLENKEEIQKTIEKFKKVMEDFTGKDVKVDDLGERRLAYEIQNNKTGYYAVFNYSAEPENIYELERLLRIDDNIMKFLTVRQEEYTEDNYEEEDEDEYEEEDY